MKSPLERLYRLRCLIEDTSRVELEAQLKEVSRLKNESHELREEQRMALRQIESAQAAVVGHLAFWREQGINSTLIQKMEDAGRAKTEYLERRKERRQVESVLSDRSARAALEHSRREQRAIDDWFAQKVWRKEA